MIQKSYIKIGSILSLALLLMHGTAYAAVASSTNYRIETQQITDLGGQVTSGSYSTNFYSQPLLVTYSTSTNYIVTNQLPENQTATSSSGSGSGGAVTFPPNQPGLPPVATQPYTPPANDHSGPVVTGFQVTYVTKEGFGVVFDTNEYAITMLRITGPDGFLREVPEAENLYFYNHGFSISGLTSGVTYQITVVATDLAGNRVQLSPEGSTITMLGSASVAPRTPPLSLRAPTDDTRHYLSWKNPSDEDFEAVVIVTRTDYFPLSIDDGTVVYRGRGESVTLPVDPKHPSRYFAAYATYKGGAHSPGSLAKSQPLSVAVPQPPKQPPQAAVAATVSGSRWWPWWLLPAGAAILVLWWFLRGRAREAALPQPAPVRRKRKSPTRTKPA